jgi:hypothetical protein
VGIIPSTCVTTFFFAIHLLILFLALVELGPLFSIFSFCLVMEFSNNVHCSYAHKVIFFFSSLSSWTICCSILCYNYMSVHNLVQPSSSWYGYDNKRYYICMDMLLSKCLRIIRILNM